MQRDFLPSIPSLRRALRIVTGCCGVFGLLSVCAVMAWAQERPGDRDEPASVVVAPAYRIVWNTDAGQWAVVREEAVEKGMRQYLRKHPQLLRRIDRDAVIRSARNRDGYQDRLALATQWMVLGIQKYKELDVEQAIDALERSLQLFESIHYGIIEPQIVAETQLYLALSYLEAGEQRLRPLVLMKSMVLLDSSKGLRRGYYPEAMVDFYEEAQDSLIAELRERGPEPVLGRKWSNIAGSDYVVFGLAVPVELMEVDANFLSQSSLDAVRAGDAQGNDASLQERQVPEDMLEARSTVSPWRVKVFLYSRESERIENVVEVDVEEGSEETLAFAANALTSRIACCLQKPDVALNDPVPESRGDSRLSMHFSFAYGAFMRVPEPIERPYGNLGISVGARFALTQEFAVSGALQILSSQRDYSGALITDNFSTLRALLGPELTFQKGDFSAGLHIAFDVTSISDFEVWGEKGCQVRPGCLPSDRIRFDSFSLMPGISVRPLLSYSIFRWLDFHTGASLGYYVLPDFNQEINFPLVGEVGLRYRF